VKERKKVVTVGLCVAIVFIGLDLLLNYRIENQILGLQGNEVLMGDAFQKLTYLTLSIFGFFGVAYTVICIKIVSWLLVLFFSLTTQFDENKKLTPVKLGLGFLVLVSLIGLALYAPFSLAAGGTNSMPFILYALLTLGMLILCFPAYVAIGKTFKLFDTDSKTIRDDPFGQLTRIFPQQVDKIENKYSVNVPYLFDSEDGKKRGYINLINIFRAVLVMGTPGSGKTFGTFLAGIYQLMMKRFTFLVYDFKFPDLTEYTYHSHQKMLTTLPSDVVAPTFHIISLENTLYSERCNVFQSFVMKDFVVDAVGLMKAFFIALNPSWKNKEGDFFPESAINLGSAATWALSLYTPKGKKKGAYCTLPHVIEFLCQDVETVIDVLLSIKDPSLTNVVRPFQEAKNNEVMEQLQGQMGSVRIVLSRLTSPKLYWMLTEAEQAEPFNLELNSKQNPKVLCMANSGQNQGVNNIVLSLFLVQICRFCNKKNQQPLAMMLDEAVTLSFPRGTLDTIVATGRDRLISVWIGIQDKSQLIRDMGRDVADAIFKMVSNILSGSVHDESAKILSDRMGEIRIMKKTPNESSEGEISYSYSEAYQKILPESFISKMSQGTMAGIISDDIEQKLPHKAFYGEIAFQHPFKDKKIMEVEDYKNGKFIKVDKEVYVDKPGLKAMPYSEFWQKELKKWDGQSKSEIQNNVDKLLDQNFRKVIMDVATMKADLLGTTLKDENLVLQAVQDRMEKAAKLSELVEESYKG